MFKNKNQIIKNGKTPELRKIRGEILEILNSAVEAVNPYQSVKSCINGDIIEFDGKEIDLSSFDRIFLAGFGKASVGMSQAVCDSVNILEGIVVTDDSNTKVESPNVFTFVGGHPIPDQNSVIAAEKIIELAEKTKKNDLLFVLISGGGSALFEKPRVALEDLQETTDLLLKSGANINEVNTIRKHLSYVKGGQLVKNVKGTIISLVISDIIGDPLEFIASGPTYPDSTTFRNAEEILKKYNIWDQIPDAVKKVVVDGASSKISETPKRHDLIFERAFNKIVANNKIACDAAIDKAEELGYKTILLTTNLEGEAREVGKYLADKAANYQTDVKKIAFISGGETTVKVKGEGRGGRNQEMVLSSIFDLDGKNIVFTSFATDGVDGNSDAAGAIADKYTLQRSKGKNKDPMEFLEENNSYEFFRSLDDLLITQSTGTNVMDIQIIVKIG